MKSEESRSSDASQSGGSAAPPPSESTASSVCSSCPSYRYDPKDFPKVNEIEEIPNPSFESWTSAAASLSQSQSPARPIRPTPYKKPTKLIARMEHLNILLSGVLQNKEAGRDVISNAQQAIDMAMAFITRNGSSSLIGRSSKRKKELVSMLQAAIVDMSQLLSKTSLDLVSPIQLADQLVTKVAVVVQAYSSTHGEFSWAVTKVKAERLAGLLRMASGTDLYERPLRRILTHTIETLRKALRLVDKYRTQGNLIRRAFPISIPDKLIMEIPLELDNTIDNISWLIWVSKPSASVAEDVDECIASYQGPPPLASSEPMLWDVWEHVAKLLKGSQEDKAKVAAKLASATGINHYAGFGMTIIEEGGLDPLLKLVKEGAVEAKESAASALAFLSRDPRCVEVMARSDDACSIFVELFLSSIDADVGAINSDDDKHLGHCSYHPDQLDGVTCCRLAVMAARALSLLAKESTNICKIITSSRLMLHIPTLLQQMPEEVQCGTAMLVLEIAGKVELDPGLWSCASHAAAAFIDHLPQIIGNDLRNNRVLLPCIKAVGCLSQAFSTTAVIRPLVQLLVDRQDDVTREATVALLKFAQRRNGPNGMLESHCDVIIAEGSIKHLVRFVRKSPHKPALLLMCYLIIHDPEKNWEIKTQRVIDIIELAANQGDLAKDATVWRMITEAKIKLAEAMVRRENNSFKRAVPELSRQEAMAATSVSRNMPYDDPFSDDEEELARHVRDSFP